MIEWASKQDVVLLALIASLFTWSVTAIGASTVFFFKELNKRFLNGMLGFAAGVMIAASFWSLLNPAIEMANSMGMIPWIPATIGFLGGGVALYAFDRFLPHLHIGLPSNEAEGIRTSWHRSVLLVMAITLHNIPEGLAIGVAFGALAADMPEASLTAAIALTIGIGLQNFPEGIAVAVPLRREGFSRKKAFMYGQSSAIVEPVAAVLGALAVVQFSAILPFALSFAAGAMIFVVVEELIPESQQDKDTDTATIGAMLGFAVMMMLDVALG